MISSVGHGLLIFGCLFAVASGFGKDNIGLLKPVGELAVSCSVTNLGVKADYTFTYVPATSIPSGGILQITFPRQYTSGLGITGTPSCVPSGCTVSGYVTTFTLSSSCPMGTTCTAFLSSVLNPATAGGTGPFQLVSMIGSYVLDMNLNFGVIGIEQTAGSLTSTSVSVTSGKSSYAGQSTQFDFLFTLGAWVPAWSWMRFTFPGDGFIIQNNPTCTAVTINRYKIPGNLFCSTTGTKVFLTGISTNLQPGASLGVRIAVTNPQHAVGTTGTFTIEIGRNSTNTVYQLQSGIPGVAINPGVISAISLVPTDTTMTQSTGNLMRYTLVFTLFNPIEQGGSIQITCNNNFKLKDSTGAQTLFWVNSGLTDISSSQPVTSVYSLTSNILTISNFQAYASGSISLMLELLNPSTAGNTLPLGITSYRADGTTIIDRDLTTAVTTILVITSPAITTTYLAGNLASQSPLQVQFTIIPNLQVPAGGYITVKFPSSFTVSATPTCNMKPTNIGQDTVQSCTFATGLLTAQLKLTTTVIPTGSGSFLVGVSSYISVTTGITASTSAGKYSLELQTFDQNLNLLESGNAIVLLTANVFTTSSINSVHNKIGLKTIITVSFTPLLALPSGAIPTSITTAQGFIEVSFPTADIGSNAQFPLNLGITGLIQGGAVPCLQISGITPATTSGSLTCILTTLPASASSSTPAVVTIWNFNSVSAGTAIVLHFPGITHVATTSNVPAMTLTTYQITNRVRTNLNTITANLVTNPANNAIGIVNDAANTFTSVTTTVAATTTVAGTFKPTTTVNAGVALLFIFTSHDNGYCAGSVGFTCIIGATTYPCTCYPTADVIYLAPGAVTYTSGVGYTYSFAGLANPTSVPSVADSIGLYTISNFALKDTIAYTHLLPIQTPGSFSTPSVQVSATGLSYVNVRFYFTMVPTHAVPAGGTISITFPAVFALTVSNPLPVCTPGQLVAQTSAGVGCNYVGSNVVLSNFQKVFSGSSVVTTITGVKNPSSGASTGYFAFSSYNAAGLLIDSYAQVTGFSFGSTYVQGSILFQYISVLPSNGKSIAEYAVGFTISTAIPAGGQILLSFPVTQFGMLSNPPDCRLNGAATYFQSCTTSGNTIIVTLSTSVSQTNSLIISLFNVLNFVQGTSSAFSISTNYDGLTLDTTGTSNSGVNTAVTTAAPSPLVVNSIAAYPQNEGEMATYTFTITPVYNIQTSQSIVVTFPGVFDSHVGSSLVCSATGLTGYVTCSVTGAWLLSFSSTAAFTACTTCNIVLTVYGVINPPMITGQNSGQFALGVFNPSGSYTEFTQSAGYVTFLSAPTYNNLWSLTTSNRSARDINNLVLNMTMTQTVPQTQYKGAVWVQFPPEYSLLAASITCESSSYWAGGVPECSVYNNRVILNGQVTDYVGNLIIYLFAVPNPLTEVTAYSITAKTYDGLNFKVLDSSYPNTNPTGITYAYPGPLITINNNQPIYIEAGTLSGLIPVSLTYPVALNLTLVPQADAFTFVPYTVELTIGDLTKFFKISVHDTTPATKYVITWTTEGDNIPPYYTPIQYSVIMVTSNKNVQVYLPDIKTIPLGGSSLPTWVNLQNAPDVDLTVSFTVSGLSGLSITPSYITFSSGVQNSTYVISTIANVTTLGTGNITYSLTGTNVNAYSLQQSTQVFTVGQDDGTVPVITGVSVSDLRRTSATVVLISSKPGIVYYMSALYGTPTPSYQNTVAGGPVAYPSTLSVYGNVTVDSTLTSQFSLSGLTAQTKYSVYLWISDQLGRASVTCSIQNFTTLSRYATAQTMLKFNQVYIDDMEVSTIVAAVGLVLSLDSRRILTAADVSQSRRLASTPTGSFLELFITDDPKSDNYPSPNGLVLRLSSQAAALSKTLPTLDLTWTLPTNTWTSPVCSFLKAPMMTGYNSFNAVSFLSSLQNDGVVYATIANQTDNPGQPLSAQIATNLDLLNRPVQGIATKVTGGVLSNSTFLNLAPATNYAIYITCGNANPGQPDLLADGGVVQMTWTTAVAPNTVYLNLNGSRFWRLAVMTLLAFIYA